MSRSMLRNSFRICGAVASLLLLSDGFAADKGAKDSIVASIQAGDLKRHVAALADDAFEGREAGSRGGRAAAGYLVDQLQRLKLEPAGEAGSYYQKFENYSNVLAKLPGSDTRLASEIILVGAHYDHVGYGNQRNSYGPWGKIHNGADDNASGIAGLLELAEAIQQSGVRPRRTLLFAFWDAEEKGLLGSKHWVRSPTLPLSQIKCAVNVDMIGRATRNRLEVYGVRTATTLRSLVSLANTDCGLDCDFSWTMKDDSDHFSFYERGIPSLMVHTGLHADYHRPSDDTERLNLPDCERVARLLGQLVWQLANDDTLPPFRAESRKESDQTKLLRERAFAGPAARLGVQWKPLESGATGLLVTNVVKDSAGDQAGIRVGDRIVSVDDEPISNDLVFRQRVLHAQRSLRFEIASPAGVRRTIELAPRGEPIRTGITWRTDDAEPGALIVSHVVFGSPAHTAGVLVNDRLLKYQDASGALKGDLAQALESFETECILTRERAGRIEEVKLAAPTLR